MQKVNRFKKNIALQVIQEKQRINKQMLSIIEAVKSIEYSKYITLVGKQIEVRNSIFIYSQNAHKYNSAYGITHNHTPIDNEERPITNCIEVDYYNYCILNNNFKINIGSIEDYHRKGVQHLLIPKFNSGANKDLYTKLCIDIFNDAAKDLQAFRVEKQTLVDDAYMIHFGFYVNRAFY
jgi:hypothetical protein